jgi:hypothetical protein
MFKRHQGQRWDLLCGGIVFDGFVDLREHPTRTTRIFSKTRRTYWPVLLSASLFGSFLWPVGRTSRSPAALTVKCQKEAAACVSICLGT